MVRYEDISELIKRRRLQIMIHSIIYYIYDDNVVSDAQWSEWAMELVKLQNEYPELAMKEQHNNLFLGFDGSTGYDIAMNSSPRAQNRALSILKYRKEHY